MAEKIVVRHADVDGVVYIHRGDLVEMIRLMASRNTAMIRTEQLRHLAQVISELGPHKRQVETSLLGD